MQKALKTVSDFATKYAKENKEAQAFVEALKIEEYQDVLSKQTELIETVKKNQGNQLITEITVQTKGLRTAARHKLIKQLLRCLSTAAKRIPSQQKQRLERAEPERTNRPTKTLQQQLRRNPEERTRFAAQETEYLQTSSLAHEPFP
ncbi:MAG: hypothetical protein IPL22_22735 [Bacteroidetes bacterium]|nr:hypothetical protein [Bacteroidota bacterium]